MRRRRSSGWALAALLVACAPSACGEGSVRAADIRVDKDRAAKALQEKVVLRDLCFDLGHLKLSRVKPATSEEFRALEAKTLTFLETAGSSRLLAPRRRPCEVLATLRPGRLIGISKPLAVSGAVIVEVRFAIAGA